MVFPWGKHKGKHITEVPSSYLMWCFEQEWCEDELKEEIRKQLARRLDIKAQEKIVERVVYASATPIPAPLKKPVQNIISTGFRHESIKAHPDQGGKNGDMRDLIAAREWLRKQVS